MVIQSTMEKVCPLYVFYIYENNKDRLPPPKKSIPTKIQTLLRGCDLSEWSREQRIWTEKKGVWQIDQKSIVRSLATHLSNPELEERLSRLQQSNIRISLSFYSSRRMADHSDFCVEYKGAKNALTFVLSTVLDIGRRRRIYCFLPFGHKYRPDERAGQQSWRPMTLPQVANSCPRLPLNFEQVEFLERCSTSIIQ